MSEILKLKPAFKDYLWGGQYLKKKYCVCDMEKVAEAWVLSTHRDGHSIVCGGRYDGMTLSEAVANMGDTALGSKAAAFEMFPQMIKIIDAEQSLSLQVHPSDEYALKNEGQYGKTEMWYILDAKEGAGIYYGVKEEITKEQLKNAIATNTVEDILNFAPCTAGESYFIPSGTLHAIGAGLLIAEVQQNSNVTYRVYDYGRVGADGKPRELHIEKALKVSDLSPVKAEAEKTSVKKDDADLTTLSRCPYFTAVKAVVNGNYRITPKDSFMSVLITKGDGEIDGKPFSLFDTFFIPADTHSVTLSGDFEAVITYCE
ncbi:MAG: mannose-6-phosphate isomerase [Ruminococcaceae bacterium]|nr:mannose-6-phosphate isomerase [Oscillospiraceae bacterium]